MRLRLFLGLVALVGAATPASSQQADPQNSQVHVVRPGDTLWELARRYLSDPYRWAEIFELNRQVISDPNWIYPDERLMLPLAAVPGAPGPEAGVGPEFTAPRQVPPRTIFFEQATGRAAPVSVVLSTTAAEVPVVAPGSFYAAGLLLPDSLLTPVGQLVENISPTVLPRQAPPQIQPFDHVNMTVRSVAIGIGTRVHLMRPERLVEPYGRIFVPTGTAIVLAIEAGIATVEIERMYDQVAVGDLAMEMPQFGVPAGVRPEAREGLEGILVDFELEQPVVAREDLGFLNLGTTSGVVEGDEFIVYQPAELAPYGIRPAVDIARLQVVRSGPQTSAVRVVSVEHPALAPGLPVRLVAKMP